MKLNRERMFIALVLFAVIITPAFTIYYIHRTKNPVNVSDVTQSIRLTDGTETVYVSCRLKNTIPVDVKATAVFQLPDSLARDKFFLDTNILLETSRIKTAPKVEQTEDGMLRIEIELPPFESAELKFTYGFNEITDTLYVFDLTGSFGKQRGEITLLLDLPADMRPAGLNYSLWEKNHHTEWNYQITMKGFGKDGVLEIPLDDPVTTHE